MNFDEFLETKQDQQPHQSDHPKGFKPGIEFDGKAGKITTKGLSDRADLDWDAWIDYWLGKGASKTFYVKKDEPVNFRVWDGHGKDGVQKFYYFKTNLYSRETTVPDEDIKVLMNKISKIKPKPRTKVKVHESCLVVALADWQIGKQNTEIAVDEYFKSIYAIKDNLKELRRKYKIEKLVLTGMGDLLENTCNFFPMQLFETQYDNRQQMKIARRMLTKTVEILAPLFADVLIICAAGNHGERRTNGKANTSFGDNADLELFENVSEIFSRSEAFKHVKWIIPDNSLTLSVQVLPKTVLSIAHGHQCRYGQNAQAKVVNWFTKMASQKTKGQIYDTDVLLVGHFHHHFSVEVDTRLIMGCTSQDHSGQQWFAETGGGSALAGTTTFVMHNNDNRKWSDINIY
mgnify:FL=1